MTLRISRLSTPMDQQGRVFVPRDIHKAMRLSPRAAVEFIIGDDGIVVFREAQPNKRAQK